MPALVLEKPFPQILVELLPPIRILYEGDGVRVGGDGEEAMSSKPVMSLKCMLRTPNKPAYLELDPPHSEPSALKVQLLSQGPGRHPTLNYPSTAHNSIEDP